MPDIGRKTMKQRETGFKNLVMILSFIYGGVSAFLAITFYAVYKAGGELLFLGRFLGPNGGGSLVSSLALFLAWLLGIGAVVSFLAGWNIMKSNHQTIQQVIEVKAEREKKQVEHRAEAKVKKIEEEAKSEKPKEEKVQNGLDPEVLLPDEKKLIKVLQKHDGAMTQKDLVRESGLSKVKVSRVLKKLETKKIITKYEFGMTNRIMLEKKLDD